MALSIRWQKLPLRRRRHATAAAEVLEERTLLSIDGLADPQAIVRGDSSGDPQVVIGTDDRVQITDTTVSPYKQLVNLLVTFRGGAQGICSGVMISPRHVLTAAHCIYDPTFYGRATRVEVIPGLNDTQRPFGSAFATRLDTFKQWQRSGSPEWDMGLITLDRPLGNRTGFHRTAVWNNSRFQNATLQTAGYPGDKGGTTMWYATGPVQSLTKNMVTYGPTVDTFGGQSGSAVWADVNGRPTVVAIHAYGSPAGNSGVRITAEKWRAIEGWMKNASLVGWENDGPRGGKAGKGGKGGGGKGGAVGWDSFVTSGRESLTSEAARSGGRTRDAGFQTRLVARIANELGGQELKAYGTKLRALDRVLDDLLPVVRSQDVDGLWSLLADDEFRRDLLVAGVC